MPTDDLPVRAVDPPIRISPSAPSELFWLFLLLTGTKRLPDGSPLAGLREREPELAARAAGFWADGSADVTELLVLAFRGGTLFDDGAERFLATIEEVAAGPDAPLGLESETPDEIARVRMRLERLRGEPALRREYAELLGDVWAVVQPLWEAEGRAAVRAACDAWPTRLARAGSLLGALPAQHIARRFEELVQAAVERGEVVVTPMYAAGGGRHILALPGLLLVGSGLVERDRLAARRAEAEAVVSRLKVLSDPTRVLIVGLLASEALSVTDLVADLGLAQPTISVHVRHLREAGLLDVRREGGRTLYSTTPERIDALLDEARTALRGIYDE